MKPYLSKDKDVLSIFWLFANYFRTMNGRYLNKLLGINAVHALYRADGKWYHHLKRFPGVLFDDEGYIVFPTEASYINHPKNYNERAICM